MQGKRILWGTIAAFLLGWCWTSPGWAQLRSINEHMLNNMDYSNGGHVYHIRNGKWEDKSQNRQATVQSFALGPSQSDGSQDAAVVIATGPLTDTSSRDALLYILRLADGRLLILGPEPCGHDTALQVASLKPGHVAVSLAGSRTVDYCYTNSRIRNFQSTKKKTEKIPCQSEEQAAAPSAGNGSEALSPLATANPASDQKNPLVGTWRGEFHLSNSNGKAYTLVATYTIAADGANPDNLQFKEVDALRFDKPSVLFSCCMANSYATTFTGTVRVAGDTVTFVQKTLDNAACGSTGVDVYRRRNDVLEVVRANNGLMTSGVLRRF